MGTWGENNFDSDEANEFLDRLIDGLVKGIDKNLANSGESGFLMRKGEKEVIPSIDIIVTLCNHYNSWPRIELEDIDLLQKKYLAIFDRDIKIYADDEYITKRRNIIIQTFETLREIAKKWDKMNSA